MRADVSPLSSGWSGRRQERSTAPSQHRPAGMHVIDATRAAPSSAWRPAHSMPPAVNMRTCAPWAATPVHV